MAFGLSCSPFLLNTSLKHHILKYKSEDPQFVQKLLQSFYVDDILTEGSDDDEVYDFYIKEKTRLTEGGFSASVMIYD